MKRFLLTVSLSCFLPAIVGMPSQANNIDSLDNLAASSKQSKLVAQAGSETPGSTTIDPSAAPAGDKATPDKDKKVDPSAAPAGDKATPDKPAPDKAMPDATTPLAPPGVTPDMPAGDKATPDKPAPDKAMPGVPTPLAPPSGDMPAGDKATPDKPAPDKAMPGAPDATTPLAPPGVTPDMPAGDKATPEKAPDAPGIVPSDAPVPPPGADPSMSPAPGSAPAPVKPAGDGIRRFMRSSAQGAPNAAAQAELEKVKAESSAFLESVKNPNASQLDQSAGGTSYPSPTW